jgi:hypothetical protein
MSAGELESGNAGEPAKLIRQRYREASDVIKKGKLCSLFINDLDAGGPLDLPSAYFIQTRGCIMLAHKCCPDLTVHQPSSHDSSGVRVEPTPSLTAQQLC